MDGLFWTDCNRIATSFVIFHVKISLKKLIKCYLFLVGCIFFSCWRNRGSAEFKPCHSVLFLNSFIYIYTLFFFFILEKCYQFKAKISSSGMELNNEKVIFLRPDWTALKAFAWTTKPTPKLLVDWRQYCMCSVMTSEIHSQSHLTTVFLF